MLLCQASGSRDSADVPITQTKADELYRPKSYSFEYIKISLPLTVSYPFPHNSKQLKRRKLSTPPYSFFVKKPSTTDRK